VPQGHIGTRLHASVYVPLLSARQTKNGTPLAAGVEVDAVLRWLEPPAQVVRHGAQPNVNVFAPLFTSARPTNHGTPFTASVEEEVDAVHWLCPLCPLALVARPGALANASVFAWTQSSARLDKPGILRNASAPEDAIQASVPTAPPPTA